MAVQDKGLSGLYDRPMRATRSGPLFNAFPYPTKISPEAIALFLATHTKPGDTILDAFAGSGTTGLAALLCERPTNIMLEHAAALGLDCKWGPRTTYLYEVGTLGSFVSNTLTHPPDSVEFRKAAASMIAEAKERLPNLYESTNHAGASGKVRYVIWSDVISCPNCSVEITYWSAAVSRDPLALKKAWRCGDCGITTNLDACPRVQEHALDVFGQAHVRRKRVPVEVHGTSGSARWKRPAVPADGEFSVSNKVDALPASAPNVPLNWGDLHRAGYHQGIERLHHLYTPRNFLAVATCLDIARSYPEPIRAALELLVLSYNASHATIMTRIVVKSGLNDFVLTSAQSGVLYVSSLPVEKNVFLGLERKARTLEGAFALVSNTTGGVNVVNATSENLALPSESVDYVFTDPPFGSYIPYAELNQINELWMGSLTDRSLETIVSQASKKTEATYGKSLAQVFREIGRVLKPHGKATVVFHSAHSEIWRALTTAFDASGLVVERTSILDKQQPSFKQVVSEFSVKGDPLILLSKARRIRPLKSAKEVYDEVMAPADKKADLRALYSAYAAACVAAGVDVELGAEEFQRLAAERLRIAA